MSPGHCAGTRAPSSQKSGDTVTFVNKDRKPWSRTPDGFALDGDRATNERLPFHLHRDCGQRAETRPWCRNDVVGSPAAQRDFTAGEHPRLACSGGGPAAALADQRQHRRSVA